jgi:hypothetical protein
MLGPVPSFCFLTADCTILVLMAVVGALMRIREEKMAKQRETEKMKRLRINRKLQRDAAFIQDVLRQFDLSKTQTLNFEEVRSWLLKIGSAKMRGKRGGKWSEEQAWKKIENEFPGASAGLAGLDVGPAPHHFASGDNRNSKSYTRISMANVQGNSRRCVDHCSKNLKSQKSLPISPLSMKRTVSDVSVSDEDVEWILMMVMERKEPGSFDMVAEEQGAAGVRNLELQPADFEFALHAWLGYIHCKPMLEEVRLIDQMKAPSRRFCLRGT